MSYIQKNRNLFNQAEIARELGCSTSNVNMAITGYRKGPAQKKLLVKIEKLLLSKFSKAA